jgi:hypothetical protein
MARNKPIAKLSATIAFEPSKIRLHQNKCNNNQNSCANIEYCVSYDGKHIRDSQSAVITLEITDSKLRVKENRAKINNTKNLEQKTIELRANKKNCFSNDKSFLLMVNVSAFKKHIFISNEIFSFLET